MAELPPSRLKEIEPVPIAELKSRQHAVVRGRIVAMTYPSEAAALQLRAHMKDATGTLIVQWPGRREIPDFAWALRSRLRELFRGSKLS